MLILVVNAGSSSLKYQVRDTSAPESEQMITSGLIENIGTDVPDHEVALHMMAEKLEGVLHGRQLQAIGHRVVQGAEKFTHPVLLNEQVIDEIDALSPLAPLHNPRARKGYACCFPHVARPAAGCRVRYRVPLDHARACLALRYSL